MNGRHNSNIPRLRQCPCGSGRRYKHCHGSLATRDGDIPNPLALERTLQRAAARELQRQQQQGLGKPIVSGKIGDRRVVALGGTTIGYGDWTTFEDMLANQIKSTFGRSWWIGEEGKPPDRRHPIMRWAHEIGRLHDQTRPLANGVISAPLTGAAAAYFGLAYNLFLLQYNVELLTNLVDRLKSEASFYGAYYEAFVAACFILAGFELTLEDELDSEDKHHEFTARHKTSGRCYSVEAKSRQPGRENVKVISKLRKALKKDTKHPRIVFIDANVSHESAGSPQDWNMRVAAEVKESEATMFVSGKPAPPAYVIVTNHPYHYELDKTSTLRTILSLGFKRADFGYGAEFPSFIEAFKARRRHADVISVLDAMARYMIPSTFDGEIPEFAFGEAERRWCIGDKYDLSEFAAGATGMLTHGLVAESAKTAHLVFQLDDGRNVMGSAPMTDAEIAAYRRHPQTFFGAVVPPPRQAETPLELFEFFYEKFKNLTRAKMLEFFKNARDLDRLTALADEELLLVYCERHVLAVEAQRSREARPPPG